MNFDQVKTIREKINNDSYTTTVNFVPRREDADQYDRYREDAKRLSEVFKQEAIEACGLKGHPKAEKAYDLAWDNGHSSGFHEVLNFLIDLAELLED